MTGSGKLIINAAITGMLPTKADTPHVPVTVDEIVACVKRVRDAGAAVVHLHARDSRYAPTADGSAYQELVGKVREDCPDILVCVSLSGRMISDVTKRAAALVSRPDLASLTLGSMNLFQQVSANPPDAICALASMIYDSGALPEIEVFEAGHVNYMHYLIRKGVLRPPYYLNFILGALGTAPLDLTGLGHMHSMLPPETVWSVGGVGKFQLDANVIAIASGGHVRTGLEDNLYFDRNRNRLADNAELVDRIVRIARDIGREPATPDEARRIIGIPDHAARSTARRTSPAGA